jgi:hypothetical protein
VSEFGVRTDGRAPFVVQAAARRRAGLSCWTAMIEWGEHVPKARAQPDPIMAAPAVGRRLDGVKEVLMSGLWET